MQFDTKIAIVLLDDLPVWQKTNTTAFLVSGFAAADPSLVGEPYVDGSDNAYSRCSGSPSSSTRPTPPASAVRTSAPWHESSTSSHFTRELFATPRDEANPRPSRRSRRRARHRRHRVARASVRTVNKVLDKLRPHT